MSVLTKLRRPAAMAALGAITATGALAAGAADQAPRLLHERLATARPGPAPVADGVGAARVLFTRTGDDNAAALLVRSDANGDLVPEVVVGWDIFKTGNNLEVLSGGSLADGQAVWALETADGISGGYFSDVDQLAEFADVTGDGVAELIGATSGGGRAATVYDGATGEVVQSFNTYLAEDGWVYDIEVVGDVNGNGTPDFAVATGSDSDAVYMIDGGLTGEHHDEIWAFPATDVFYTLTSIGDVDGDGITDLAAGAGDNLRDVYAISGRTGGQLWTRRLAATPWDIHSYPDANGDGVDEVIAGVWSLSANLALLDGASGVPLWEVGTIGDFVMIVLPMEDVDEDGVADIAVASWASSAKVVSGADGSLVWEIPTGGDVWALALAEDVTADGVSDVAFGSFDGVAYFADGAKGELLWTHDANGHKVLTLAAGPDLDGDGGAEVVAGAQQLSSGTEDLVWALSADSGVAEAGPDLTLSGGTGLGDPVTFSLAFGTPGDAVSWVWGTEPTLEPVAGGWIAVRPLRQLPQTSVVDAGGTAELNLVLPTDPALVGQTLYLQAIEVDPGPPRSATTTNRVGLIVTE